MDRAKSDIHIRERVLEAVRGLAASGLGSGIGGHVSIRVPDEVLSHPCSTQTPYGARSRCARSTSVASATSLCARPS